MNQPGIPTCWKCGYDLRGLQVTDVCPECGTPVWSTPPGLGEQPAEAVCRDAKQAQQWGIASLLLLVVCLGPLSVALAIPAIVYGSRARAAVKSGRISPESAKGSMTGLVCAWITVGLSLAYIALMVLSSL